MSIRHPRGLRVAAAVAAIAVIGTGAAAQAKVTISHYHKWNNDQGGGFLVKKAAEFEKLYGVKVNVVTGGWDDRILTMATAGVMPDVVDIWSTGGDISSLMEDLTPYVSAAKVDKLFMASAQAPFRMKESSGKTRLVALSNSTWTDGIGYNRKMFAAAGLVEPPKLGDKWTWATMADYAAKMTQDTNGDGKKDFIGLQLQDSIHRWSTLVYQAGGELADVPNRPKAMYFNTTAFETAMDYAVDLLVVKKAASLAWVSDFVGVNKWGMTWDGSPWIFRPKEIKIEQDRWYYPKGPANNAHEVISTGYGMSKGSKNKKEAFKWIQFLTADKENAAEWTRSTGRPPALKSLSDEYMSLIPKDTPTGWQIFGKIPDLPDTHNSPSLNQKMTDAVNKWITRMWTGKISVKQGAAQMHIEVNKAIPTANKR